MERKHQLDPMINSKGFGLLEVMVTAALMAGLAVVGMRMHSNSTNSVKLVEGEYDLTDFTRELRHNLTKKIQIVPSEEGHHPFYVSACFLTFKNVNKSDFEKEITEVLIPDAAKDGAEEFDVNKDFITLFQKGDRIKNMWNLKRMVLVQQLAQAEDGTMKPTGYHELALRVERTKNIKLGVSEKERKILFKIDFDNNGKVVSCYPISVSGGGGGGSGASGSDGSIGGASNWIYNKTDNGNFLYFTENEQDKGYVGIGPVAEPSAPLEISNDGNQLHTHSPFLKTVLLGYNNSVIWKEKNKPLAGLVYSEQDQNFPLPYFGFFHQDNSGSTVNPRLRVDPRNGNIGVGSVNIESVTGSSNMIWGGFGSNNTPHKINNSDQNIIQGRGQDLVESNSNIVSGLGFNDLLNSHFSLIHGHLNEIKNSQRVMVAGSVNKFTDSNTSFAIGSYNTLLNAENSLALGSNVIIEKSYQFKARFDEGFEFLDRASPVNNNYSPPHVMSFNDGVLAVDKITGKSLCFTGSNSFNQTCLQSNAIELGNFMLTPKLTLRSDSMSFMTKTIMDINGAEGIHLSGVGMSPMIKVGDKMQPNEMNFYTGSLAFHPENEAGSIIFRNENQAISLFGGGFIKGKDGDEIHLNGKVFINGQPLGSSNNNDPIWADNNSNNYSNVEKIEFSGGGAIEGFSGNKILISKDVKIEGSLICSSGCNLSSDKNLKRVVGPVEDKEILEKVLGLDIEKWEYKKDIADGKKIIHLGPYAQDFKKAFGLGDSDKQINFVDLAGVSLRANQALIKEQRALKEQVSELEKENELLRESLDKVISRLEILEKGK